MPTEVKALAAPDSSAQFSRTEITRRDPGPDEVLIDIKYAGICHSDIHTARGEWGPTLYPLVPGHEIAGVISQVGTNVRKHQVGDRVGVGCFVDSCGQCAPCLAGEENYCADHTVWTYNDRGRDGEPTRGGYSQAITVRENYVLRIPDSIPLDRAAPLLCAGITPYSPLVRHGAGPGKHVAIIGMGGLGHMGVQLAHALGAEVSVLSRSLAKREDGLALGADNYYAASDPATAGRLAGAFDLIVSTVSADMDVDAYVNLLALNGTLVFVGLPPDRQSFSIMPLCSGRRSIAGSNIGGIRATQEMLDLCAEKGIAAKVEVITADDVTATYDRVVAGAVRYRAVIDISTL
ncbi:MAG: NAD(P)-dependent alcohol dehydrogenase [Bifidobacteriaceae bacterium]|nr:NAD(P)-dependent alcohol dehydrogenase [Bifidobacteriaceae bacterium]